MKWPLSLFLVSAGLAATSDLHVYKGVKKAFEKSIVPQRIPPATNTPANTPATTPPQKTIAARNSGESRRSKFKRVQSEVTK